MRAGYVAMAVVVVMMAACVVPVVADELDAADSLRMSDKYVLYAQFEKEAKDEWYYEWYYDNTLYFIDGSPEDQEMKRYIEDPYGVSITDDQREAVEAAPAGTLINVYELSTYYYDFDVQTVNYNDQEIPGVKVMDPSGSMSFFVKAGDTITLTIHDIEQSYVGSNVMSEIEASVYVDYQTHTIDPTFSHQYDVSTEMSVDFNNTYNAVYWEVSYDVSGISEPNGSATLYIAICAVITVLVLALLVYAGIKPKWAK